jgi:hypothetical protein
MRGNSSEMERDISEAVKVFILNCIASVEQLEVLLLLKRDPARKWSAKEVADEIRTSYSSAERRLKSLHEIKLLTFFAENQLYSYHPLSAETAALVDDLAQNYRTRPYRVIDLIFSKPVSRYQNLADAFKIKKD